MQRSPSVLTMIRQLGKYEPRVFGILLTATIVITIMRLGIFGTIGNYWNKFKRGLTKCSQKPYADYVCVIIGSLLACIILHIRHSLGEGNRESFTEFALQNRSLTEAVAYLLFVGLFSWIYTHIILAYGSRLLKISGATLRYDPTHSVIMVFLGFTTGHFANLIWFNVVQLASAMSPNYRKASEKYATGTDFIGSLAPIILTGICIFSANFLMYFENRFPRSSRLCPK